MKGYTSGRATIRAFSVEGGLRGDIGKKYGILEIAQSMISLSFFRVSGQSFALNVSINCDGQGISYFHTASVTPDL